CAIVGLGNTGETGKEAVAAALVLNQKALGEMIPAHWLAVLEIDAGHFVAARRPAIPRATHGDEGVAAIFLGEGGAGVEGHLHWRGMGRVAEERFLTLRRPLLQRHALGRVVLWVEVGEVVNIGPAILLALLDEVE